MSNNPPRPFGLPYKSPIDRLADRVDEAEKRFSEHELDSRERLARVETKVDSLIDAFAEDREERRATLLDRGRTERARLSSRTRIFVALFSAAGVIAGACATVLASGCN